MIIIAKPPKQGKTTELVEKYFLPNPKWEETLLLVEDDDEKIWIIDTFNLDPSQSKNIQTYHNFQIIHKYKTRTRIKYLLIDDITHFLFHMFQPLSVEAITLQTNKEIIERITNEENKRRVEKQRELFRKADLDGKIDYNHCEE